MLKYFLLPFFISFITKLVVSDDVQQIINIRQRHLENLVRVTETTVSCSESNFVFISEYQFGRSGNNLIEFAHGLWLANRLNRTLAIPQWMNHILLPFDTSLLDQYYCYEKDVKLEGKDVISVTSEDSFFFYKVFKYTPEYEPYHKYLPVLNEDTIISFTKHFIKVYAALWSHPLPEIRNASQFIIKNYLGNNFRYSSVHKRTFEGGCNKVLSSCTSINDYDEKEIAMFVPEWKGNLWTYHPLCNMPSSLVFETLKIHNRSNTKVFVAFDGRGSVDDLIGRNATVIHNLKGIEQIRAMKHDLKFLDLFIAIHGDFFLLNPRSTFSWEVFVVRTCLGLQSVPKLKNHDFYVTNPHDLAAANRSLWVSWQGVYDSILRIR